MTDQTKEWAERIGRKAAELGFIEWANDCGMVDDLQWLPLDFCDKTRDYKTRVPAVGNRLTAKAFEMWTEYVALVTCWAAVDAIERGWSQDGTIRTYWIDIYTTVDQPGFCRHEADTAVEAELAAIKTMLSRGICSRAGCDRAAAYDGADYCGAACSAQRWVSLEL